MHDIALHANKGKLSTVMKRNKMVLYYKINLHTSALLVYLYVRLHVSTHQSVIFRPT